MYIDSIIHICKKCLIEDFFAAACRQLEFGVQAIFGPTEPVLGAHIQSICEALDVPHVEARLDLEPHAPKQFSINLHPGQQHMNQAFRDLMTFLNWTKLAIIYEEDYGKYHVFHLRPILYNISYEK